VGENPLARVRIKLTVIFIGQPSDPNTYFYQTVISLPQYRTVEEMASSAIGNVLVESTNDEIVTDMNKLKGFGNLGVRRKHGKTPRQMKMIGMTLKNSTK